MPATRFGIVRLTLELDPLDGEATLIAAELVSLKPQFLRSTRRHEGVESSWS